MTAWWAHPAVSLPVASQSWRTQALPPFCGAFAGDLSEILLRSAGASFAGFNRERSTDPLDQGHTEVQCCPIEQVDPANRALRLVVDRLGWMIVATVCGGQCCVHDGFLYCWRRRGRALTHAGVVGPGAQTCTGRCKHRTSRSRPRCPFVTEPLGNALLSPEQAPSLGCFTGTSSSRCCFSSC